MKVLITGTSRGIGRATAELFLNKGHEVVGLDIAAPTLAHPHFTHITADVRGELPEVPDVEVLINNAGVQGEDDIGVNLTGTIRVTEKYAFHQGFKAVIFMASAAARTGAEFPVYAASKGGVVAYMKNVAGRLAPYGATANSISAGGVITPLNDHILNDPHLYEQVLNETMLGKWASAEEIAQWAYFLAVINKSMTGEDLLIDNGEALKSNFIW